MEAGSVACSAAGLAQWRRPDCHRIVKRGRTTEAFALRTGFSGLHVFRQLGALLCFPGGSSIRTFRLSFAEAFSDFAYWFWAGCMHSGLVPDVAAHFAPGRCSDSKIVRTVGSLCGGIQATPSEWGTFVSLSIQRSVPDPRPRVRGIQPSDSS